MLAGDYSAFPDCAEFICEFIVRDEEVCQRFISHSNQFGRVSRNATKISWRNLCPEKSSRNLENPEPLNSTWYEGASAPRHPRQQDFRRKSQQRGCPTRPSGAVGMPLKGAVTKWLGLGNNKALVPCRYKKRLRALARSLSCTRSRDRTGTDCSTGVWDQRVYRFRHPGWCAISVACVRGASIEAVA